MLENILIGFSVSTTFGNLAAAFIGTFFGIIFGALPGLTANMGVALLVPITFAMSPTGGLIMLSGIYCGAIYGGSIPAVLLHTPGTPAAIVTMQDGYALCKKGEGRRALTSATLASFAGGLCSALALLFLSPYLAQIAVTFGPPEYFCLGVFGMSVISSMSGAKLVKGMIVGFFGILLSCVGMDPVDAVERLSYGLPDLLDGFTLVPVLIGLFSIPEALDMATRQSRKLVNAGDTIMGPYFLPLAEYLRMKWNFIKSSVIGVIVGIIPAAGPEVAPFISYREEIRSSKTPELFGTGIHDGVVAAECANNGCTGGSLIPLLTLGIPGSAVAAVYLGALTIHGLMPGPMLFQKNPDIVYGLFIGFIIIQFMMLGLGLMGANLFVQVVKMPERIIAVLIFFFCIMGSLAIKGNVFDVWVMFVFGLLGVFLKRFDFPAAPIVMGLVLGPILEQNFFASMMMSHNSPWIFVTRPLSIAILALTVLTVVGPMLGNRKKGGRGLPDRAEKA